VAWLAHNRAKPAGSPRLVPAAVGRPIAPQGGDHTGNWRYFSGKMPRAANTLDD